MIYAGIFFLWVIAMVAIIRKPLSDRELEALAKIDKRLAEDLERTKRGNR